MFKALRFFAWPLLAGVLVAMLIIQRYPQWVGLPSQDVNLQQAPQTTSVQPGPVSYADAVIIAGDVILVLEFKVGASSFDAASRWQVEDYCMNLRDFHAESLGHTIVPVLCATDANPTGQAYMNGAGHVTAVQFANAENLHEVLLAAYRFASKTDTPALDPLKWIASTYRPTLSIIEA